MASFIILNAISDSTNLVHTNIITTVFFDHKTYQYDPTESLAIIYENHQCRL